MTDTVQTYVITRFSILIEEKVHSWNRLRDRILPTTWFAPRNPTLEEKRAYLFNPDRLDTRFDRFERMLLPSIAAQNSRPDHVVLTSETLPEPYLTRLRNLSETHGFRLHPTGTDRHVKDILTQDKLIEPNGADRLVTIRIDDDDAMANTLVSRVKEIAQLDLDDFTVSFPKGIYLDERRPPLAYTRVVRPGVACGLARIMRSTTEADSVHGAGNHKRTYESLPFLQFPDKDMYVQTVHDDTISYRLRRKRLPDGIVVGQEDRDFFQERFGFQV